MRGERRVGCRRRTVQHGHSRDRRRRRCALLLPAGAQAIVERTRALEAVCARHGVPLAAAALQFPLHHPAVASVVVGHEQASEVARNLALLEQPIPTALWSELKDQALIPREAPMP
jgi:D-threo-aldose 1-dehydrogenase